MRGFYGIGVSNFKTDANIGTLWRTAHLFGAAFIFTLGREYKRQASDTSFAARNIPYFRFDSVEDLKQVYDCPLVAVEEQSQLWGVSARPLPEFIHPERAVYLLGSETNGLSRAEVTACHCGVYLDLDFSLNVATMGSLVMYDRYTKGLGT